MFAFVVVFQHRGLPVKIKIKIFKVFLSIKYRSGEQRQRDIFN